MSKISKAALEYDRLLKRQRLRKRLVFALALFVIFAVILFFVLAEAGVWQRLTERLRGDYEVTVSFIDVGQGDSILICAGETSVLVDTGGAGSSPKIFKTLAARGVDDIDILVLTHPHADHIGTAREILKSRKVKRIIICEFPESLTPDNYTYTSLINAVVTDGIPIYSACAGDSIELDKGYIEVLAPFPDMDFDGLNNYSLVLRYVYGKTAFLLMADAERESEEEILYTGYNLACNVIKIGHHGSRYSSLPELLNRAGARYAVISCGLGNSYGYPHAQVLERISNAGSTALRTDLLGTIEFGSDGERVHLLS